MAFRLYGAEQVLAGYLDGTDMRMHGPALTSGNRHCSGLETASNAC